MGEILCVPNCSAGHILCLYSGLFILFPIDLDKDMESFVIYLAIVDIHTDVVLKFCLRIMLILYDTKSYRKLGENPTQERCCINGVILHKQERKRFA